MITKTIAVSQMATVLGWTLTAVRECIARDRFPFAYAWQSPGKKSRSFVIDKEGFRTFLINSLGWDVKVVDAEFKSAGIH
nr:MAG TPA: Pyocin activator protein PrtN [Caudoviricetes sp.]DAT19400.1 MAG TPA: Pyocin activator protein PrtN [Caudoviricetes sp.]